MNEPAAENQEEKEIQAQVEETPESGIKPVAETMPEETPKLEEKTASELLEETDAIIEKEDEEALKIAEEAIGGKKTAAASVEEKVSSPAEEPKSPSAEPTKPSPEAEKPKVEEAAEVTPSPKIPEEVHEASPTSEELSESWNKIRVTAEADLAETHYALSEDMIEELQTNADTAIPKIAAKVYLDAVQMSLSHIVQSLPQLVGNVLEARNEAQAAESVFYETWPNLSEHKDVVKRLATTYRQTFPNASLEDITRDVGAQAMVALRIPLNGQVTTEPAQPARHIPASGSPPSKPATLKDRNPFSQMSRDLETEDLDLD